VLRGLLTVELSSTTKNLSTFDMLKVPSYKFYPCGTPSFHQPNSIPPLLPLLILSLTAFSPPLASGLVLVTQFLLAFEVFVAGYPSPRQKRVQPLSH
jgi:hypothetical protein